MKADVCRAKPGRFCACPACGAPEPPDYELRHAVGVVLAAWTVNPIPVNLYRFMIDCLAQPTD